MKTIVTGIEMTSPCCSRIGVVLRGVTKEQVKNMLEKYAVVMIRGASRYEQAERQSGEPLV